MGWRRCRSNRFQGWDLDLLMARATSIGEIAARTWTCELDYRNARYCAELHNGANTCVHGPARESGRLTVDSCQHIRTVAGNQTMRVGHILRPVPSGARSAYEYAEPARQFGEWGRHMHGCWLCEPPIGRSEGRTRYECNRTRHP